MQYERYPFAVSPQAPSPASTGSSGAPLQARRRVDPSPPPESVAPRGQASLRAGNRFRVATQSERLRALNTPYISPGPSPATTGGIEPRAPRGRSPSRGSSSPRARPRRRSARCECAHSRASQPAGEAARRPGANARGEARRAPSACRCSSRGTPAAAATVRYGGSRVQHSTQCKPQAHGSVGRTPRGGTARGVSRLETTSAF